MTLTAKDLALLIEAAKSQLIRQGWPNDELSHATAAAVLVLKSLDIEVAA